MMTRGGEDAGDYSVKSKTRAEKLLQELDLHTRKRERKAKWKKTGDLPGLAAKTCYRRRRRGHILRRITDYWIGG
jgi:hypothetical protein